MTYRDVETIAADYQDDSNTDESRLRQLDMNFKELISDTNLLAEIARGSIREYENVPIEDIRR